MEFFTTELFVLIFGCIVFSVGVAEILGWLMRAFYTPPKKMRLYCLLPLTQELQNPELLISWTYFNLTWDTRTYQGLILLDLGITPAVREVCERLCTQNEGLLLCTPQQLDALYTANTGSCQAC